MQQDAPREFTYRRGTLEDITLLKAVGLEAYSEYRSQIDEESWGKLNANLQNDAALEKLILTSVPFLCEDKGTVAGVAYFVPHGNPTAIYPANWSYIRMVGVLKSYRNRGIAAKLIQLCIDEAVCTDEKTIGLHTSELMHSAIHIYKKAGFTFDREINRIFGMRYSVFKIELSQNDDH